jgi:hypothetical protein
VVQGVRGLPRKHEALSSTLVLQKQTKQTNKNSEYSEGTEIELWQLQLARGKLKPRDMNNL